MKKNIIIFIAIGALLSACGGGGGDAGTLFNIKNLTQHTSTGVDKIKHNGKGQKIGITESGRFGDLAEYRDRMKVGLDFSSGIKQSYKPATGEVGKYHSAMVGALAGGKNFGIAKEVDLYPYVFKYSTDLDQIYDHAKANKLVAVNQSWRAIITNKDNPDRLYAFFVSKLRNDVGASEFAKIERIWGHIDEKAKKILSIVRITDGSGNQTLHKYKSTPEYSHKKCTYLKHLYSQKNLGNKLEVITDPVFNKGVLSSYTNKYEPSAALIGKLKDLICNTSYSTHMNPNFYNNLSISFLNKLLADANNGRDGPIWVWAAGNEKTDNPLYYASLPGTSKYAGLKRYWLAVVNIDGNNYQLSRTTAKCGQAKSYCLGAIGANSKSIDEKGKAKDGSGTSAAAPQVTAGLAVIKSAFPTKTNVWVRARILATARHTTANGKRLKDKSGKVVTPNSDGLSDEFGHGIMRLDLATKPVGSLSTASGGTALLNAKKTLLDDTKITVASETWGDAFRYGMAGIKTKVFDIMGAGFDYNLSHSVYNQTTKTEIFDVDNKTKINQFATGVNYTNKQINPYANNGDINFSYGINKNLSMSYITDRKTKNTFQINKRLNNLNLSSGLVLEKGSFLGAKLSGAFKTNSLASTQYIKADYNTNINGFNVMTKAVYGLTQSNSNNEMLKLNKAYSFATALNINKGNWGFGIKMPLRVISARGQLKYVSRISKGDGNNDNLHYTTKTIDLTPTGKHTIFNVAYKKGGFSTGIYYHKDKHHIKDNNEKILFSEYKIEF